MSFKSPFMRLLDLRSSILVEPLARGAVDERWQASLSMARGAEPCALPQDLPVHVVQDFL